MGTVLWVGAGGFLGSVLRYLLAGCVQSAVGGATFPYGTLVVNITGCFGIGFVSHLIESLGVLGPEMRAFFVIGILGGFTTYSAFGNETINLIRDRERLAAALNVGAHLVLAIGGVWLGRAAAHAIWR